MTAAVYWAAGAAAGIADGCVLAVEELFPWPGGAVLGACGIESPRSKKAQGRRGGDQQQANGGSGSPAKNQLSATGDRVLSKVNSFPVDDLADDLGAESGPDAGEPKPPPIPSPRSSPSLLRRSGAENSAGALRVPKLKLPKSPPDVAGRQDTTAAASASASSSLASPSPPPPVSARLTEQAVHPINAAFEAARGRGGGGGGAADEPDALTIATTNRYTYGLGPGQAASTPRSDVAASEGGGEHKKRGGLFRALRRKGGSKANQALR